MKKYIYILLYIFPPVDRVLGCAVYMFEHLVAAYGQKYDYV